MNDQDQYISARRTASMIGCCSESVPKVAAAAKIRIILVPGLPTRYHLGDVEALIAGSFQVAGSRPETTPQTIDRRRKSASV